MFFKTMAGGHELKTIQFSLKNLNANRPACRISDRIICGLGAG